MSQVLTVFLPNKSRYRLEISKSTPLYQDLGDINDLLSHAISSNNKCCSLYNKSYPDLGTPVGMLNLSNLTELELVPASEVPSKGANNDSLSIALQYGTQRYTELFSCDTSLWDLIAEFGLKHPGWIPSSLEADQHPVLVHMRHEVPGEPALRGTSLRHLGLQPGSPPALFRLAYRPVPADKLQAASKAVEARNDAAATLAAGTASSGAEKPVAAAPETTPAPTVHSTYTTVISHADSSATSAAQASSSDANLFSPFRNLPAPEPARTQQQQREPRTLAEALNLPSFDAFSGSQQQHQQHQEAALLPQQPFRFPQETVGQDLYRNELAEVKPAEFAPCDRRLCLFLAGGGSSAAAASASGVASSDAQMEEPDDSFFNLTESDLRKLMADLKRKVDEETNAPLLTRQQRDQRRDDLYSSYEVSVIRLFFPDRRVVQAAFRPRETVFSLCKFVRSELLHCSQAEFFLYTTPPKKEITDMAQYLIHADLVPMPIVHVGFRTPLPDGQPILKDEIVAMTTNRADCDKVALACMRSAVEPIYAKQQQQQQSAQSASGSKGASTGSGSSNMPKWFKK